MEASSTGSEDTANYWSGFGSGNSQKGPFWGHSRPHFRGFSNSGPNVCPSWGPGGPRGPLGPYGALGPMGPYGPWRPR